MQKISDVIRRKYPQFNTITADTTMYDALHKMFCEHVDFLIILQEEKFVGILTEHDIAAKVFFADKPLQHMQVRDFMTTSIPVTTNTTSIEEALQLLQHHNSNYIAVYDEFTFKGILNMQDLMQHMLSKNKAGQEVYH